MTVGAKNNYARAVKLDLTFFSFGFYIFEVFSTLLRNRRRLQDVYKEKQSEVSELTTTYSGVLLHAQQQDKLNAKRLIHGICSIFRLLFTKLILNLYLQSLAESISCPAFTNISTMHRRKKRQTSAKRHDDIVTPGTATLQQTRFIVIRKQFCGNSANSCVRGASSDEADDVAERTIVSKE